MDTLVRPVRLSEGIRTLVIYSQIWYRHPQKLIEGKYEYVEWITENYITMIFIIWAVHQMLLTCANQGG
jgi:hypothetical protein